MSFKAFTAEDIMLDPCVTGCILCYIVLPTLQSMSQNVHLTEVTDDVNRQCCVQLKDHEG